VEPCGEQEAGTLQRHARRRGRPLGAEGRREGLDPADLVSWPDTPLDFSLETLDAGEIEDMNGQQAAAARLGLVKRATEKETRAPSRGARRRPGQPVGVRREGPEASEPQGTEGTSCSGGKGGRPRHPASGRSRYAPSSGTPGPSLSLPAVDLLACPVPCALLVTRCHLRRSHPGPLALPAAPLLTG